MQRHHFVSLYSSAVHLDRQQFDRALALEAGKAGATVHLGTGVSVTADRGGDYVLQLRGGETKRARFLALAVGRSAGAGRFHQRRYHLNDHACLVGYLSGEPGDSRTLIEAVRDGWIYAAALPGRRMVAALTTSAGMIPNSAEARLSFWRETIARSLLMAPAVLLVDEPSMGLAPMLVRRIFEVMEDVFRRHSVSVLLVEQDTAVALTLADDAYLLEQGRITESGSHEEHDRHRELHDDE